MVAALSAAGLPTDRFHFLGFLPDKPGKARRRLDEVAPLRCTVALYVSPFKIGKTLGWALEALGDREACVCRELTKRHETFDRGTLSELSERYAGAKVKGEITLLIAPPPRGG